MKFWIYLQKELIELLPEFQQIFGVTNLYHDYENVWEWIESEDLESEIYVNISRTHNWVTGNYDKPIMIKVKLNNGGMPNEQEIAQKLKDQLKCDVFAGEISVDSNDNPVIKEQRKY